MRRIWSKKWANESNLWYWYKHGIYWI